jgi:hypothetical protein
MADDDQHRASVDAWLERADAGMPPEQLLQTFAEGFDTVWRRAHRTLGEVTLVAIGDRVLHNAAEQFPTLSVLKVESTGLQYKELGALAVSLDSEQLLAAMRFVLLEFLTVLGALTAEILSPALHAELAKLGPEKTRRIDSGAKGKTRRPDEPRGEESKS